jgi:cell volume regulation protein A
LLTERVSTGLLLISLIIIIGFLSNYQFLRTGFPGILFLIILGFIVGPWLQLVGQATLVSYAPYLADLATIFILFESGLAINLRESITKTPRALLMSGLHLLFCTLAVMVFLGFIGIDPAYGVLIGIMLSGNSTIVLAHLLRVLPIDDDVESVLRLESKLNSIFQVVLFLTLIEFVTIGQWDLLSITRGVVLRFGVGVGVGVGLGIVWLNLLSRIKREAFGYMLTIAVLFIIYYSSEFFSGDGALAALMFGVVLSNQQVLDRFVVGEQEGDVFDDQMVQFEVELCFLIRTFFFVYIGLSISISDPIWIIYGIILSTLLFVMRFVASHVAMVRSQLQEYAELMSIVIPRGLNEAVLTVVLVSKGVNNAIMLQNITFLVIIITNLFYMISSYRLSYLPFSSDDIKKSEE